MGKHTGIEIQFRVDDRHWTVWAIDTDDAAIRELIERNLSTAPEFVSQSARIVEVKMIQRGKYLPTFTRINDGWLSVNPLVRFLVLWVAVSFFIYSILTAFVY